MLTPSEHKTVQARILEYAEAIGWTMVSREEAERRRGFDPHAPLKERAKGRERDLINYSDKVEGICYNQRTLLQLVSVKDYA